MSTLPAELWDHSLSLISPEELQHTALALSRALATPAHPASHISHALLWRFLRITREGQAWQCIQRLWQGGEGPAEAVRTVNVEVWRDDPQLLVNLLISLPALRSLSLSVGPLAAPEHLDDLVSPTSLARTKRWAQLEQLSFRFNPYVSERSYYTFLKGAYFDSLLNALTNLPPEAAPKLRRLAFSQDLPPTHGTVRKETLAFGLHDLADSLDQVSISSISVPTSGRYGRKLKTEKMEFAQPIIFFQLTPLTLLSQSPLASHLTHLTFRLPRRNLLTALTDLPISPLHKPPFPFLKHLDLSTTHVVDDARFPTLLRLVPSLESLVLDRCSGLISAEAVEEPTTVATLRWLGKCCATIGLSRSEDALRAWRRIAKDRPTDAPNISRSSRSSSARTSTSTTRSATPAVSTSTAEGGGADSLVPPVRDLVLIPPPSRLRHLGLGLHDLSPRTSSLWTRAFGEGYRDGLKRTVEKLEEGVERWERWGRQGVLGDGGKRLMTFADALPALEREGGGTGGGEGGDERKEEEEEEEDPDPTFARFSSRRRLVPLTLPEAKTLHSLLLTELDPTTSTFNLCTTPDCSNSPGVPHLSLAAATALGGFGEADPDALGAPKKNEGKRKTKEEETRERREKERKAWVDEAEEERKRRETWRERHIVGCAHERAREAWGLEQFA